VSDGQNPRKSVPSAIRKTFARIVVFYVGGIFVIGLVVDSSSKLLAQATAKGTAGGASASPFVVAIQAAGIKTLPNIINACIYLFTFSAANSDQYIATRTLYGMAKDGLAPRIFTKCTTRGVPWVAFVATGSFMGLSFLCASSSALTIFNYMVSTVVTMAALAWISILGTHIAFMRGMKAQGISRQTLPYKSPFQPYLSYYGLLMTIIITIFKGFDAFMPFNYKSFVTNYIGLLVYGFGYAYYKLRYRTRRVSLRDMDLSTDAAEFDGDEVDLPDGGDAQSKLSIFSIWHYIRNW
jgi:amino acid transporter